MTSDPEGKTLPIKWPGVEEVPILFANQILVQHVENAFVISFGQLTPPAFLQPPTPEEVDAIDAVNVKSVARFGVTPDMLLSFIKVLQTNYRNYQAQLARRERER